MLTAWYFLFRLKPCKTWIRSDTLINSFMYCHETIGSAYEGTGWAFPTKTFWHALPTHFHFQNYKILHCSHFSPSISPFHILKDSLEPNWQLLGYFLEDGLYRMHQAPMQHNWNVVFNTFHCPSFHCNPVYKSQC